MLILIAAVLNQTAAPSRPATDVSRMAALYDEVCLKAFPTDGAVDAAMVHRGATPLSASQIKAILRDDAGRGWRLSDGDLSFDVVLESPPFKACSVRAVQNMSASDLSPYRAVIAVFKETYPGFVAQPPMDVERNGIRIHAEYEARPLPGGGGEVLIAIDQRVVDASQLTPGTTATPLRFVHQIKSGR